MTKQAKIIGTVVRYAILILVGVILIYPLVWMVGSTFKENIDIMTGGLRILPPEGRWRFDAFESAWQLSTTRNMIFYYMNTMRFLIPRVVGTVLSCTLVAFAIGRFSFPGKKIFFTIVLITLLMPDLAFRIPVFILYSNLGLVNTFASLYLHDFLGVNSFFVFMIIQFMRTIPRELDEASVIDGCGPLRTLFFILVPVLRPIIITVGLLTFMWGMNDFQGPLIFLRSPENNVLAQGLRSVMEAYEEVPHFGRNFAAAFMGLVPTIGIFFLCSRYFVDGEIRSGGKE
ncbi:MAG: carbohydrate ABC transporter permease [Defluviitaleaceae bacterium]|nr:carbohydrate ABC transporter permease [Defluviitaleaceae bacterium]